MGNVLKMETKQQIKALLNLGWSYRAIEKTIGVRRETVSKYDHRKQEFSKPAKVPTDQSEDFESRSNAHKYDTAIKEKLKMVYLNA